MFSVRLRPRLTFSLVTLLLATAGCGGHRAILAPQDVAPASQVEAQRVGTPSPLSATHNPALTFEAPGFRYTYPQGTWSTEPQYVAHLDVAAGTAVTVSWSARARGGARIAWYQWALDIEDVFDGTPRIDEATDLSHWSQRSLSVTSAVLGPFAAGTTHVLYVDVSDTNGLRGLGMVAIHSVE